MTLRDSLRILAAACLLACGGDSSTKPTPAEPLAQEPGDLTTPPGDDGGQAVVKVLVRDFRLTTVAEAGRLNQLTAEAATFRIDGDLVIGWPDPSLSAVQGLVEVTGDLTVEDSGLLDLSDLAGLASVGGDMQIAGNAQLVSLRGLDSLTSIGGDMLIAGNAQLASLRGLDSLTSVGGFVSLRRNPTLAALSGLGSLTTVGTTLRLEDNGDSLQIDALSGLRSVGSLFIAGTGTLTDLRALGGLTTYGGGQLTIERNAALTTLHGLEAVTATSLQIDRNARLQSLTGLEGLRTVRAVSLNENPSLSSLEALAGAAGEEVGLLLIGNQTLHDLRGLEGITSLSTVRVDRNAALESFAGLESVTRVEYDCWIRSNSSLASLAGLSRVASTADLHVTGNPLLPSLTGLEALRAVGGELRIRNNAGLRSIEALAGLATVSELVWIDSNDVLETVAFPGLSQQVASFQVTDHAALVSVDVGGLEGVAGSVWIDNNAALRSLAGSGSLAQIASLHIADNPSLVDISALDNLAAIDDTEVLAPQRRFRLLDNAALPATAVERLLNLLDSLEYSGSIEVEGNSTSEPIDCAGTRTFYDRNGNEISEAKYDRLITSFRGPIVVRWSPEGCASAGERLDVDDDADGTLDEDPIDGSDNDGDGTADEDP